jgi:tRNA (guanine-N7-)-methyltransferase
MTFNWKNPYIDKLETLPDLIIAGESTALTDEQISTLRHAVTTCERTYLELGSGSGAHLIGRARQDTSALYIGFELRYKRAFRTAEKAAQQTLQNILVARTTATLVPDIFTPGSIAGIYVNFPDPWAKKKWKKHRLLNEAFIQRLHPLLKESGFLSYKTDHQEYFEESASLFKNSKIFEVSEFTTDLHRSEFSPDNVMTEFENLFVSKGLPTYYIKAVRK